MSGRSVDRRKDFRTERKTPTAAAVPGLLAVSFAMPLEARTGINLRYGLKGCPGKQVMKVCEQFNAARDEYEIVCMGKGNCGLVLQAGIAACRAKEHTHILQGAEIDNAPVARDVAEQVDGPSADPVAEIGHPVVVAPARAPGSETAGMAVLPAARVELRPPPGIARQVTSPGDLAEAVERHRAVRVSIGMQFPGKRASGSLDLVQRGRGLRAEDVGGILHTRA